MLDEIAREGGDIVDAATGRRRNCTREIRMASDLASQTSRARNGFSLYPLMTNDVLRTKAWPFFFLHKGFVV
jgi:hypothetical protein